MKNDGRFTKGMIPWNKGKKDSIKPWNKGKKGVQQAWNKGLTKKTDERIKKMAEKKVGTKRKPFSEEWREKIGRWKRNMKDPKTRKRMLDGQAAWMNKFHKNPSREQIKILNMVHALCPYVELNYPVYRVGKGLRSYSIDIAIPKLDLAIEFDGYFHFIDDKTKEYHKRRQKDIEEEGWKFIRYTIFDKFPIKEELWEKIKAVIK